MSAPPFGFAIIGCGVIAGTHADALAALASENVQLRACCDIVPEKAQRFAAQYGIQALDLPAILRDPQIDAVIVCTPSGLHAAVGAPSLEAGKHVVIEKPMDITLEACDRLIAAQRRSGKTLAVIAQHRFDEASQDVKQLVDSQTLGKPILINAQIPWHRTQEYYDSGDWRGTWPLDGGGCLMNQGIHTADLVRWLCGPVQSVYAQARTAAHERIETEDVLAATLTFESGAIGALLASTSSYPGFPVHLAIYGTHGTAVIEADVLQTLAIPGQETLSRNAPLLHALQIATGGTQAAAAPQKNLDVLSDPALTWGEAHRLQLADFVRCCRTGERPLIDGIEGRNVVALVLAIYESARTGQVVTLANS